MPFPQRLTDTGPPRWSFMHYVEERKTPAVDFRGLDFSFQSCVLRRRRQQRK
jgi:hypothetical protein